MSRFEVPDWASLAGGNEPSGSLPGEESLGSVDRTLQRARQSYSVGVGLTSQTGLSVCEARASGIGCSTSSR